MRILDPKLPLTDPRTARMAAETIVCCGFNATRAARELRPDLKAHRAFAHRLMREPLVLKEIERIMEKPEMNPQKFLEMLASWAERLDTALKNGTPPDKATLEAGLTGARLLARGYISEKKPLEVPEHPMVNFDLGNEISNLTEAPVATKVTQ